MSSTGTYSTRNRAETMSQLQPIEYRPSEEDDFYWQMYPIRCTCNKPLIRWSRIEEVDEKGRPVKETSYQDLLNQGWNMKDILKYLNVTRQCCRYTFLSPNPIPMVQYDEEFIASGGDLGGEGYAEMGILPLAQGQAQTEQEKESPLPDFRSPVRAIPRSRRQKPVTHMIGEQKFPSAEEELESKPSIGGLSNYPRLGQSSRPPPSMGGIQRTRPPITTIGGSSIPPARGLTSLEPMDVESQPILGASSQATQIKDVGEGYTTEVIPRSINLTSVNPEVPFDIKVNTAIHFESTGQTITSLIEHRGVKIGLFLERQKERYLKRLDPESSRLTPMTDQELEQMMRIKAFKKWFDKSEE